MDQEMPKKINGAKLAEDFLTKLKSRIVLLRKKKIIPTLAVIQVGDLPDSNSYIKQKSKVALSIGAKVIVNKFPTSVFFQELAETILRYNTDPSVHGIIIQRPLPPMLSTNSFNTAIDLNKDIDGFRIKSKFKAPIALAVLHILRSIYQTDNATLYLKNKQIVLIGRGETAGKPIAELFSEKKIPFIQCHSKTTNMNEFTQEADIIISCVGKKGFITNDMIKEGVILIGVGMGRDSKGKLYGDYNEREIEEKASFYTPTPSGAGPLNVAYLLSNLITAAES
jgi:methylenetetrahydrofolate dehydrogenase (NADP+)/methenyltetrahydrofolate cyclohydrolase